MLPPRHTAPRHAAAGDPPVRYLAAAIVAVLVTALGALNAASPKHRTEPPSTAAAINLTSQTEPRVVASSPTPRPAAKPAKRKPVARKAVVRKPARKPVRKVTRWLPTGTGMWLHDYSRSMHGNGRAIVLHARHAGLSHLFVQTGSSKKGWIGSPALRSLLPQAKAAHVKVIAWDFADLRRPEADARRLANAAWFRCRGCARVAAVAPDIETAAEGTSISGRNVQRYYTALRRWLPRDVAILATIPWPSEKRVGRYPYAVTARHADALLPMAYWYNRSPSGVTATSMRYLRRFHRPIMPVGQGYDGRLDAPYLAPDRHPYASVRSFAVTARHYGARSVSLWSWQTTGRAQWKALAAARRLYAK